MGTPWQCRAAEQHQELRAVQHRGLWHRWFICQCSSSSKHAQHLPLLTFPISHGRLCHNLLALVARSLSCHSDQICPFSISSHYSELYPIYCIHFVCLLSNCSIPELVHCFLFLLGLLLNSVFSLMLNSTFYIFSCELFSFVIFYPELLFSPKIPGNEVPRKELTPISN